MHTLDYTTVHAIAVRSLQQLDADMQEHRSLTEIEKEAHKFASVLVDVLTEMNSNQPKG